MILLDENTLTEGLAHLSGADADLAASVAELGQPPLRQRPPGFATLLQLILEQQVSLASARATYQRLEEAIGSPTAAAFLDLNDRALRAIGFSRQKARYSRALATALEEGRLELDRLAAANNATVRSALTALPGIGEWTAEVYLLVALRRRDAWPVSDLGVIVGAQQVKNLPERPARQALEAMAEPWQPWRGLATFVLWNRYLQPS